MELAGSGTSNSGEGTPCLRRSVARTGARAGQVASSCCGISWPGRPGCGGGCSSPAAPNYPQDTRLPRLDSRADEYNSAGGRVSKMPQADRLAQLASRAGRAQLASGGAPELWQERTGWLGWLSAQAATTPSDSASDRRKRTSCSAGLLRGGRNSLAATPRTAARRPFASADRPRGQAQLASCGLPELQQANPLQRLISLARGARSPTTVLRIAAREPSCSAGLLRGGRNSLAATPPNCGERTVSVG